MGKTTIPDYSASEVKNKGDVSHTVALWLQVLTPCSRMFTGEVNSTIIHNRY